MLILSRAYRPKYSSSYSSGRLQRVNQGQDPLLLVLAADHVIADVSAFHQAVRCAEPYARQGNLVTFGVKPTHPETVMVTLKPLSVLKMLIKSLPLWKNQIMH